jgi:hypothetical protein
MDAGGAIRRGGYCRARKQSGPSRVDWSRAPYRTGRDEMRRSPVGEGSFGWSPAPVRASSSVGRCCTFYFFFSRDVIPLSRYDSATGCSEKQTAGR